MRYVLCDPDLREVLYPFSQLRSFADIRIGLFTIGERYQSRFPNLLHDDKIHSLQNAAIFINASFIPDQNLLDSIEDLRVNESISYQNDWVAICVSGKDFKGFTPSKYSSVRVKYTMNHASFLHNPFDILQYNQSLLTDDINRLAQKVASGDLFQENKITGKGRILLQEGVKLSGTFLNTEAGPIYIGRNVQIMEGVCVRGPVAILDNAVIKMGATIYGATTIGKKCIVGGEVKNSVFFDYSNKAHHGYIGDSVIGSWCNLGAGTSCSNIKNNAGSIHLWNPLLNRSENVGMKCGVIMGDHTKTAINTSLNSGTVTGVCCNILKAGFPPKYIPDFTWNVETGALYHETKMMEDVYNWMKMKNEVLDDKNKHLLLQLYKERINTSS